MAVVSGYGRRIKLVPIQTATFDVSAHAPALLRRTQLSARTANVIKPRASDPSPGDHSDGRLRMREGVSLRKIENPVRYSQQAYRTDTRDKSFAVSKMAKLICLHRPPI